MLAVLILAALTLVTIDARSSGKGFTGDIRSKAHDVFSPLQRATHAALEPIGNFLTGALDYGSLRRENERLRGQLAQIQNQNLQAQAESAAAQQVLSQEHLTFIGSIPTVAVQVIDNNPSNFENSVEVDKGSTSGLAVGQPVVAAGGLVGSVEEVSASTATIVVLTDPTFYVGVKLNATNTGTAQGVGLGQPLRITVDTPDTATGAVNPAPVLKVGQSILTSGLKLENFPANIPVGTVESYSTPGGASEPTITLKPYVNVNELAYLQVLLWSPQSVP